jgi:hypothetical protein
VLFPTQIKGHIITSHVLFVIETLDVVHAFHYQYL